MSVSPASAPRSHLAFDPQPNNHLILWVAMAANLLIAVGALFVAQHVVGLPVAQFGNLGTPVQVFVGVIATFVAVLAIYATFGLWRAVQASDAAALPAIARTGRYLTLALHFVTNILATVYLLHLWNVYFAFEFFVDGIMANTILLIGFPIAYAVYWIASKQNPNGHLGERLSLIALAIAGLTLMALLLASNLLGGINHILSQYANPLTWVVTIVAIAYAFLAVRLLYMGAYFQEMPEHRTAWQGWLMLSPNILGFMIFFAGPLLLSFYLSFTNSSVGQVPQFNGIQNYVNALSLEFKTQTDLSQPAQSVMSFGYTPLGTLDFGDSRLVIGAKDRLFWLSLRNTLVFCLLLVPLAVIPALFLSLILNSKLPGMKFFRAVYFLPSVAAVVGTALIWRWLYNPVIGYFNYIIQQVTAFFGVANPNIQWLTDPAVVMFSMVFLSAWSVVGYNTVLFLAGLQGIPGELYEAAQIDGANRWQQLLNVTIPMLGPTTFFVFITTIVTGLQVFNEPYTLFPAQPIPENATTAVYYLYRRGFFFFDFGYASAIAWILFAIIFTITLIQFRVQRSGAYDN